MPPELKEKLLTWVDDLAITAKDVVDLLTHVRKLLDFRMEVDFKLHPVKCRLFQHSIR